MLARRTLPIVVVAAAVAAPAAHADGAVSPLPLVGSPGIVDAGNRVRYVAFPGRGATVLAQISTEDGDVKQFVQLRGAYGVPMVTFTGDTDGLSPDGLRLVLANRVDGRVLRRVSRFAIFDTLRLAKPRLISLRGDFTFDALSPDGRRMYLVEHPSAQEPDRYAVRSYDLVRRRLLREPIVDPTEPNMRGLPYARLATGDGAWVYTLYLGGKESFVHALDTVNGRAVCLDIEGWSKRRDGPLWRMKLRLLDHGRRLGFVDRASGKRARPTLDLETRRASGLGSGWIGAFAACAAAAATALVWWQRRRASRAAA